MSKELLGALSALEEEKGIKQEVVIEALEAALVLHTSVTMVRLKTWKFHSMQIRVKCTFMRLKQLLKK